MNDDASLDIQALLAQAGWMQRIAQALLKDPHAAEDVVQEAWLRALRNPPAGAHEPRTLRKWLRVVTQRIALRRLESDAARQRREAEVARPDRDLDAESTVERLRLQRSLAGHLLELRTPLRTAVLLQYQEGLSPAEVAKQLGISNEAARQRVSRGLSELRKILDKEHDGDRQEWNRAYALLATAPGFIQGLSHVGPVSAVKLAVGALVLASLVTVSWMIFANEDKPSLAEDAPKLLVTGGGVNKEPQADSNRAVVPTEEVSPLASINPDTDLHGRVVDTFDQPVASALVEAVLPQRSAFSLISGTQRVADWVNVTTRTNRNGEFKLCVLTQGMVDLHVNHESFAGTVVPDRLPGENVIVRLTLAKKIRGMIRQADGMPVAGAHLRLDRAHVGRVYREVRTGVSGAEGEFEFADLASGRFVMQARSPNGNYGSRVLEIDTAELLEQDLKLSRGRVILGNVTDGDGQPLSGVSIVACRAYQHAPEDGGMSVTPAVIGHGWWGESPILSNDLGEFEITVPLGILRTQLVVSADGFSHHQLLLGEAQGRVTVQLQRGYSVKGRCVTAQGAGMVGVTVSALAEANDGSLTHGDCVVVESDEEGRFVLANLRAELRYLVALGSPGFGDVVFVVDVGVSGVRELGDVHLSPAATISGVVVSADGSPQSGAYVSCSGGQIVEDIQAPAGVAVMSQIPGMGLRKSRTDDRGRFQLVGLSPGDYEVSVSGLPLEQSVKVSVQAGESRTGVVLELSSFAVAGYVTDVLGQPIVQAGVVLFSKDPPLRKLVVTSVDGHFAFPAVPLGLYSLRVAPNSIHTRHGNRMVHGIDQEAVLAGDRHVHVVLPPAALTKGVVVDDQGEPLRAVLIFARTAGKKMLTYESTSDTGEFVLRLPPGTTVDLFCGPKATQPLVKNVEAGTQGMQLMRPRSK